MAGVRPPRRRPEDIPVVDAPRRGIGLVSVEDLPDTVPPQPQTVSGAQSEAVRDAAPDRDLPSPQVPGDTSVPEEAPAGRRPIPGVPQFSDDPIGAIGFIIQDSFRAFRGKETMLNRLKLQQVQNEELELRKAKVGMEALSAGIELLGKVPTEDREQIIEQFSAQFSETMPGLGDTLRTFSDDLPTAERILDTVQEFAPEIRAQCGSDTVCMRELAVDGDFIGRLEGQRDKLNKPFVGEKLRDITGHIRENAEEAGLATDELGDVIISFQDLERLNEQLPDELKLTHSEKMTLDRNPAMLSRYGIKTPEQVEFEEKELFKSSLRLREIAQRAAEDRRTDQVKEEREAKKSDLVDAQGNANDQTSSKLFERAATILGAAPDPRTGLMTNLTPETARKANDIALTAVQLIQGRRASSVEEAIGMAIAGIELPKTPEIPVPPETRENLLAQNVEVSRAIPLIQDTLDDISLGTGLFSNIAEMSDRAFGELLSSISGKEQLFPDTQKARGRVAQMVNDLRRSLANNPRFAEGEQQRLGKLLDKMDPDTLFNNPTTAIEKARELMVFLQSTKDRNEQILSGRVPVSERAEPGTGEFSEMSDDDFLGVDVSSMSAEDLPKYLREARKRGF